MGVGNVETSDWTRPAINKGSCSGALRRRAAPILLSQRRYRRGKNIAKVAAARKLLILVYYGLRDGQIRALARSRAA
jgi:hypothetical protein